MVTKQNGETMTFTWEYPSESLPRVAFFKLGYQVPGQSQWIWLFSQIAPATNRLASLVSFTVIGIYKFHLIAVGVDGQESQPAEAEMNFVREAISPLPTPVNFEVS